ncbi:putative ribonuclease H protein [Trifolium medium]|uniref:Putative ribonuclease H protein n=1 Tax=Trifolium medium TaxID=97028 RepID=A0A392Q3G4_9FABA|nr:putative ribonuclease H protein [Trifolium medium]
MQDPALQPYEYVAPVVDCIKELRARDWSVTFKHVYREGNQCADYMAKLGANSMNMESMEPFEKPPDSLLPLLKSDADEETRYTRA